MIPMEGREYIDHPPLQRFPTRRGSIIFVLARFQS